MPAAGAGRPGAAAAHRRDEADGGQPAGGAGARPAAGVGAAPGGGRGARARRAGPVPAEGGEVRREGGGRGEGVGFMTFFHIMHEAVAGGLCLFVCFLVANIS